MAKLPDIDCVFVIHCKTGLPERRVHITAELERQSIPFEFVLDHDISDITPSDRAIFSKELPNKIISVILKHRKAWALAAERQLTKILVFEDDVVLDSAFRTALIQIMAESNAIIEDHAIYLSNACHMYTPRSQRVGGQRLYRQAASRAADSYVVTRGGCEKRLLWMSQNISDVPIDHLFNKMDPAMGVSTFWAEDPIVEQGSENGLFASCVEAKHSRTYQALKWRVEKFYKKEILSRFR